MLVSIAETEFKNTGPYDKAILTLSGGALALSFVFIKDIIKPDQAVSGWLLYCAWCLFVLAIVNNISGFMFALRGSNAEWHMAISRYRLRTKSEEDLETLLDKNRTFLRRANILQGIFFLLGVISLSIYVMVNYYAETHTPKDLTQGTKVLGANDAALNRAFLTRPAPAAVPPASSASATSAPASSSAPPVHPPSSPAGSAPAAAQK